MQTTEWQYLVQEVSNISPHHSGPSPTKFKTKGTGAGFETKILFFQQHPHSDCYIDYFVFRSWEDKHNIKVHEWYISRSLCGNNRGHIQVREMSVLQQIYSSQ